jgi:hypothetical protein
MIVRTAALELKIQDFDKARSHLDEILARHRGYLGGLQISTPSDHGRVLNGVLRVPVGQMDNVLIGLKASAALTQSRKTARKLPRNIWIFSRGSPTPEIPNSA